MEYIDNSKINALHIRFTPKFHPYIIMLRIVVSSKTYRKLNVTTNVNNTTQISTLITKAISALHI